MELELYRASVLFSDIFTTEVTLSSVPALHHLYILRDQQDQLNPVQTEDLSVELDSVGVDNPVAVREYKLLGQLIELCSGLAVRWKVYRPENFLYRQTGQRLKVQFLDFLALGEDIYTLECLWLAHLVQIPPLSTLTDDAVKQFSLVLLSHTRKLFTSLCQVNDGDKETLAVLETQLAGNRKSQPTACLSLEYRGKWVPCCCLSPGQHRVRVLRGLLEDFDLVYRTFEKELIGSLLVSGSKPV
jgi:hypothetical protein